MIKNYVNRVKMFAAWMSFMSVGALMLIKVPLFSIVATTAFIGVGLYQIRQGDTPRKTIDLSDLNDIKRSIYDEQV